MPRTPDPVPPPPPGPPAAHEPAPPPAGGVRATAGAVRLEYTHIAHVLQAHGVPVRRVWAILEPLREGDPVEILYVDPDGEAETALIYQDDAVAINRGW